MNNTRVVHIKREDFDVYIGRGSIWGNPYTHLPPGKSTATYHVGTRKKAIELYERYLLSKPELMSALPELKGKVLGCWCHPKACHGAILAHYAELS